VGVSIFIFYPSTIKLLYLEFIDHITGATHRTIAITIDCKVVLGILDTRNPEMTHNRTFSTKGCYAELILEIIL
jgi:branched-subunit amino acid permease